MYCGVSIETLKTLSILDISHLYLHFSKIEVSRMKLATTCFAGSLAMLFRKRGQGGKTIIDTLSDLENSIDRQIRGGFSTHRNGRRDLDKKLLKEMGNFAKPGKPPKDFLDRLGMTEEDLEEM